MTTETDAPSPDPLSPQVAADHPGAVAARAWSAPHVTYWLTKHPNPEAVKAALIEHRQRWPSFAADRDIEADAAAIWAWADGHRAEAREQYRALQADWDAHTPTDPEVLAERLRRGAG